MRRETITVPYAMTQAEEDALWREVMWAWTPLIMSRRGRPRIVAGRIGAVLGLDTDKVQRAGLDKLQKREAFFSRLALVRKDGKASSR